MKKLKLFYLFLAIISFYFSYQIILDSDFNKKRQIENIILKQFKHYNQNKDLEIHFNLFRYSEDKDKILVRFQLYRNELKDYFPIYEIILVKNEFGFYRGECKIQSNYLGISRHPLNFTIEIE